MDREESGREGPWNLEILLVGWCLIEERLSTHTQSENGISGLSIHVECHHGDGGSVMGPLRIGCCCGWGKGEIIWSVRE